MKIGAGIFLIALTVFVCACSEDSSDNQSDGDAEFDSDENSLESEDEADDSIEGDADTSENTEQALYPDYPLDDTLRINQIQVKGTHNSYHYYEETPRPFFGGDLAPLDVQAAEQGVRQFELDVHYDEELGFRVYHSVYGDPESTCDLLYDCLMLLKNWSDAHPGHHVLFIFIEPKDDASPLKMDSRSDELDELILSVWPQDRLIRPDDVRGSHATLREAIASDGWPTMRAGRDKAIFFYFDSDVYRDTYLDGHPNAEGRVMFPRSDKELDSPIGAFVNIDDPVDGAERILQFVQAGFFVRTRTDSESYEAENEDTSRMEAALASAAQMLSTDWPVENEYYNYSFDIPDGSPSRCNPHIAPEGCSAQDVENLE